MIKNIIFDLSEVIISGYRGVEKLIEKHTGIPADEFLQGKKEVKDIFLDTMRGKYTEDEYLNKLLENKNWNVSKEQFKDIIRENLSIKVDGTMNIILKLKEHYNLILLSDHVKEWVKYILNNNIELNIFEHKYFSYELGKLKSDEGTFKNVLEDLEIKAEETLFIDDSEKNINIAKQSRINVLQFTNANKLEEDLKSMEIY